MTFHSIAHTPQGWQVFRTTNGLDRLDVGPPFPTPNGACRYVDALDAMPHVSPLRSGDSAEASASSSGDARTMTAGAVPPAPAVAS